MRKRKFNKRLYILDNLGKLIKRRCVHCKVFKSISAFDKSRERKFGIHCYCKKCRHKLEAPQRASYQKIYIRSLRLRAYQIISGADTPTCTMSKIWKCCGDSRNGLWLSIDHVVGDGARHKREIKATSSVSLYRWVIKHPRQARERLQILCMNAQVMKKRANQEYGLDEGGMDGGMDQAPPKTQG